MPSSERSTRDPFRLLIPILLILAIPLAHLTPVGVALMERGWVMAGAGGAFFAIMMMVSGVRVTFAGQTDALGTAAWLLMLAYLVHQFEEHGIDLTGRTYHFITYANGALAELYPDGGLRLTELSIYRINTLLVWVPFLLAIWAGRRFPWVGLAAAGLMLTNSGLHIFQTFTRGEYNPGLATAVVLFLPISLNYFSVSRRYAGTGILSAIAAVAFGIAAHAALPFVIEEAAAAEWTSRLAGIFATLALAPLIANILYRMFRRSPS